MRELRKDSQYQMGMNFIVGENGYDFITPTLMYTDEYRWAMSAHMCGSVLVQYLASVPPPIIWTRFSNSGRHLLSMRMTDFKG